MPQTPTPIHQPVLLDSVLAVLSPERGDSYLDLTAGMGGHARAILDQTKSPEKAVLVDRDQFAIGQLDDLRASGAKVEQSDFATAGQRLVDLGQSFDLILLDLGVSSPQLDQAERGFSFQQTAKLDMRMDQKADLSAYEVVNRYPVADLTRIFIDWGEVSPRLAQRIADAIADNRPVETTTDLADLISRHCPRRGKTHPATRFFQAVRLEVNQELDQLDRILKLLPKLLKSGGRVAIISFHSLEDRLVKRFLKEQFDQGLASQLASLIKKPIFGAKEAVSNPRSRSAILRGAIKK